ncbi:MAG: transporter [Candidatus Deferrimicrobiaceae bacterium]
MTPFPRKSRSPRTIPSRGWIPLLAAAALFFAGSALAGHPLGTEDAGTQGKGNVEVELNGEWSSPSGGGRETSLGNTYTLGLSPRIDLAVSFAYVFLEPDDGTESVRGTGDTEVTLKTSFGDGNGWIPTVGFKAGAVLPTGEETKGLGPGRASGLATVIADWEIGAVLIHANTGATIAGRPIGSRDRDDSVRASLAAEWEVGGRHILLGEYLWEKNVGAAGSASSDLLVGGKAELARNLTLDVGIRWGTTDASPGVTYLAGVTLAFSGEENGEGRHEKHDPPGEGGKRTR